MKILGTKWLKNVKFWKKTPKEGDFITYHDFLLDQLKEHEAACSFFTHALMEYLIDWEQSKFQLEYLNRTINLIQEAQKNGRGGSLFIMMNAVLEALKMDEAEEDAMIERIRLKWNKENERKAEKGRKRDKGAIFDHYRRDIAQVVNEIMFNVDECDNLDQLSRIVSGYADTFSDIDSDIKYTINEDDENNE